MNIRDSYFIGTTLLNFKWLENVLSLREDLNISYINVVNSAG